MEALADMPKTVRLVRGFFVISGGAFSQYAQAVCAQCDKPVRTVCGTPNACLNSILFVTFFI